MVRIILEDIRLNKEKKQIPFKKEEIKVSDDIQPKKREVRQEDEDINESKIEEYLKSRSSDKQRLQRTPQLKTKKKIIHRSILVIFILSLIFGGIYWGGEIYQKADVVITSKHQLIPYHNKKFISSKDLNNNAVDFEIMITSDKKLKNIILTESKDVSIKAQGIITLYNEFSTTPQKLITKTFVADKEGKTYNTDNAVTIPGYKLDANKKIIPGQVDVNITAFLAGDNYNGSPTDLYITSFKGTTKYSKIYGKLKNPLIGGASGIVYILDSENKTKINDIVVSSFKEDLIKQVKALVPSGYILYSDAMTFSYSTGNDILSKTPEAEIEITGTLSVVLLNEKSLMDNIKAISLPEIKGNEIKEINISNLDKLIFNFVNKDQLITKDLTSIPFYFSGEIDAVWKPDIDSLKLKLIGISKNDVSSIFRQDPGILSAIVKIFPPWQSYIPTNITKINIITK